MVCKESMEIGDITVFNDDCMNILSSLPDKAFELAIVDPPYGLGRNNITKNVSRGVRAKGKDYIVFAGEDASAPDEEYFTQLRRVSKNQIIWGANHFISRLPAPIDSSCWIVWDKDNGATDFADCELAWTSFPTAVRKFKFRWNGMLQENMKDKEVRIHPTQKPVKLYEWLLLKFAKPGDKILDTHFGSGSLGIACLNMGFSLTAVELSPYYYEAACNRLKKHHPQLNLFYKMRDEIIICPICGTEIPNDGNGCIRCPVCGQKICGEN